MGEKIIIVDDEEYILKACRRALRDEPFACKTFSSPKQALAQAADINPAVVVSDQRMPVMEGVCFLEEIRRRVPLATRVIMTGYADINAVIQAINQGHVFRFVKKPWDDLVFRTQILQAMEYYRMNKRLQQAAGDTAIEGGSTQERLQGVLEMAGAVCHEFAQPLQVISGYCGLLTSFSGQKPDWNIIEDHLFCMADAVANMGELLMKVMAIKTYKTKPYSTGCRIVDIEASSSDHIAGSHLLKAANRSKK